MLYSPFVLLHLNSIYLQSYKLSNHFKVHTVAIACMYASLHPDKDKECYKTKQSYQKGLHSHSIAAQLLQFTLASQLLYTCTLQNTFFLSL